MPKFQIYNPMPVANDTVYFKLEPRHENGVEDGVLVVVVNADGSREPHSQIIAIRGDGRVHLKTDVNPDLGLPLDDDGRIEQD